MTDLLLDTQKALARSMAQTKQVKAVNPLNNGMPGGTFTSGDGVTLFNTAHPTIARTTKHTQPVSYTHLTLPTILRV